jgi:DMSO reductase anchor subunit
LHPAPSIVLFTTASGAGYGLLFVLGLAAPLGLVPSARWLGFAGLGLALGLITLGLLASTFHLGHPERAWRAVTQWRSSWLSREGVAALLTYLPALAFAFGGVFFERGDGLFAVCGVVASCGAALTVYCTGMIYGSLQPIGQWRHPLVAPLYLAFALYTGALLVHALLAGFGVAPVWAGALAILALALAFGLKTIYWRAIDRAEPQHTAGTATGLGALGTVRMIEPPHTETNYLLREMGFAIARKHARKLRWLSYGLGAAAPLALTLVTLFLSGAGAASLADLAALLGLVGVAIERWLFFAEATHTVLLYYGRPAA